MAVDLTSINTTYDSMFATVKGSLVDMYNSSELDAEVFARVLSTVAMDTMKLATSTVQSQPSLDKDIEMKTQQIEGFVQDNLNKEQQVLESEQNVLNAIENVKLTTEKTESEAKQNEVDGVLDKTIALTNEKITTEMANQQNIKAGVRDNFGMEIDDLWEDSIRVNDDDTKHQQTIAKMTQDVLVAEQNA